MNIFLVGFGLSESMKVAATQALRSVTQVYSQLDLDTLNIWDERNAFVGTLHTNAVVASPREYVAASDGCLIFFSGTPISWDGKIVPHCAADLARNWSQLPEKLDGQFAAVKVDLQNLQIEVLTDPLGMEQVYVHHCGSTVVISNSVRLIEQTCGLTAIDEIGASLFLSLGWVGGDRTLRESVHVLPGGYLHQWESNGSYAPHAYWPRTRLAQLSQRGKGLGVSELAHSFSSLFRDLSNRFGPLQCGLTGGRDSRVVAAGVIASGVPVSFVTMGKTESADVQIAKKIAEAFHLTHRVGYPQGVVTDRWDEGVRRLIRQTDGMVNLWQVANSISQSQQIENLPLSLWGVAGEIASAPYYRLLNLPPTLSNSRMLRTFLSGLVVRDTELLTEETRQLALQSLRETCQGFLHDGFEPQTVPEAFYVYDRVARWVGANIRKASPVCDIFTPFCTIPYIETAYSMPLSDRIAGRLHHELIHTTTPLLLNFPYDKQWRPPLPKLGTKRVVAQTVREAAPRWLVRILRYGTKQVQQRKSKEKTGPVQAEWIEAKRESIVDVCLNQRSSVLWDYVDRRSFEHIMSSQTAEKVRRQHCAKILSIATLFYYEAER